MSVTTNITSYPHFVVQSSDDSYIPSRQVNWYTSQLLSVLSEDDMSIIVLIIVDKLKLDSPFIRKSFRLKKYRDKLIWELTRDYTHASTRSYIAGSLQDYIASLTNIDDANNIETPQLPIDGNTVIDMMCPIVSSTGEVLDSPNSVIPAEISAGNGPIQSFFPGGLGLPDKAKGKMLLAITKSGYIMQADRWDSSESLWVGLSRELLTPEIMGLGMGIADGGLSFSRSLASLAPAIEMGSPCPQGYSIRAVKWINPDSIDTVYPDYLGYHLYAPDTYALNVPGVTYSRIIRYKRSLGTNKLEDKINGGGLYPEIVYSDLTYPYVPYFTDVYIRYDYYFIDQQDLCLGRYFAGVPPFEWITPAGVLPVGIPFALGVAGILGLVMSGITANIRLNVNRNNWRT